MRFTILVHEDVEGGFWGECLELPGCISQGDSLDEMDYNIREAIELVLEVMSEDGKDLSNLMPGEATEPDDPHVRKWEVEVDVPQPSSV